MPRTPRCKYLVQGRECFAGCVEGHILCHRHFRGKCHSGDTCNLKHVRRREPAEDPPPDDIQTAMQLMNFASHKPLTARLVKVTYAAMAMMMHPDRTTSTSSSTSDWGKQNEQMAKLTAAKDLLLTYVKV